MKGRSLYMACVVVGALLLAQGSMVSYLESATGRSTPEYKVKSDLSVSGLVSRSVLAVRKELAMLAWLQAQIYFHKGYALFVEEGEDQDHLMKHHREEVAHHHGEDGHEHEDVHIHEHEKFSIPHPVTQSSLLRPYIREHVHDLDVVATMMPFYRLTTTLDPNFIRAYVNGAWWLAHQFHNPEAAIEYLAEGLRYNRNHYELLYAIGRIYFSHLNNYPVAIRYFEKALEQEIEDIDEKEEIVRYLAFAYEKNEQYRQAIEAAQKGLTINPQGPGFKTIIDRCSDTISQNSPNKRLLH